MEKQELDTSWFDLKNYEKIKGIDLSCWCYQLITRSEIFGIMREDKSELMSQCCRLILTPRIEEIKKILSLLIMKKLIIMLKNLNTLLIL